MYVGEYSDWPIDRTVSALLERYFLFEREGEKEKERKR